MTALIFVRRHWKLALSGLLLAALIAVTISRNHWKTVAETWADEAQTIVITLREASGNDKVEWSTAAGQIVAMGESARAKDAAIAIQNERIDDMARRAVAARAKAEELRQIAARAEAQKAAALRRLSDMAIKPGTRSDCMVLIREADDALNLVRNTSE